ncbi:FadR/GntR family transcriptional regulator [Kribbella sp. NPDC055110]
MFRRVRIPSETELVEQLGVSRAYVREAVRGLVRAGLLATRQGDGTYVTASDAPKPVWGATPTRISLQHSPNNRNRPQAPSLRSYRPSSGRENGRWVLKDAIRGSIRSEWGVLQAGSGGSCSPDRFGEALAALMLGAPRSTRQQFVSWTSEVGQHRLEVRARHRHGLPSSRVLLTQDARRRRR